MANEVLDGISITSKAPIPKDAEYNVIPLTTTGVIVGLFVNVTQVPTVKSCGAVVVTTTL
jgi:hypothetical protein